MKLRNQYRCITVIDLFTQLIINLVEYFLQSVVIDSDSKKLSSHPTRTNKLNSKKNKYQYKLNKLQLLFFSILMMMTGSVLDLILLQNTRRLSDILSSDRKNLNIEAVLVEIPDFFKLNNEMVYKFNYTSAQIGELEQSLERDEQELENDIDEFIAGLYRNYYDELNYRNYDAQEAYDYVFKQFEHLMNDNDMGALMDQFRGRVQRVGDLLQDFIQELDVKQYDTEIDWEQMEDEYNIHPIL